MKFQNRKGFQSNMIGEAFGKQSGTYLIRGLGEDAKRYLKSELENLSGVVLKYYLGW